MPVPPPNSPVAHASRGRWQLALALLIVGILAMAVIRATTSSGASPAATPLLDQQLVPSSTSLFMPAMAAQPVPAAAGRDSLGVNAQFLFPLFGQSEWRLQVERMRESGIQIVRADATWGVAEPDPPSGSVHHFHWGYFDAIEETLAGAHLHWLPVVDFSAPWDASYAQAGVDPKLSPPRQPELFAHFAAALVARYGPGGSFWHAHPWLPRLPVEAVEVWNEENTSTFWQPAPDASRYLSLYEDTRAAIYAVSPRVEVMVGGLANPAPDFLSGLYAAGHGRRNLLQAVAVHPYAGTAAGVIGNVAAVRSFLDGHGALDVPIDVTEFGWPTRGDSSSLGLPTMSDAQRATALSQVTGTLARSDCGVERILPHTWVTQENSLTDAAQWFGLANPNGSLTRSAIGYAHTIQGLEAASQQTASLRVCRGPLAMQARVVRAAVARPARSRRFTRLRHRACIIVRVGYGGDAVNHATVALAFAPDAGRAPARLLTRNVHTNDHGYARGCLAARRSTAGTLTVTTARPDFAGAERSQLRITLR